MNQVSVDMQCMLDVDSHIVWAITRGTLQGPHLRSLRQGCLAMSQNAAGELQELGRDGEEPAIRLDERRQAEVREQPAQAAADVDMDRPSDPGAASSSDP
ncbi:MAG: hypothetical protein ACKPKO_24515, partial [Candidatus Fonsibacter sp.]